MADPGNTSPENRPIQGDDAATMAAQFFASGGLLDFANQHPESEYRLWLITRPDGIDLERASEKRTRSFERAPMSEFCKATIGYAIGSYCVAASLTQLEAPIIPKMAVALFTSAPFLLGGNTSRKSIPHARQRAKQQRALHESVFGVE